MIFVTGATGNAGGAVVRALAREGQRVRALVRADSDALRLPATAEVAVGDLNRPETLRRHVRGVEAAFLLYGELDESEVGPTVERVTGRPPHTFDAWARAHAGAVPIPDFIGVP
jgi:uncharacterized protein YbjT (DUF2867 family)